MTSRPPARLGLARLGLRALLALMAVALIGFTPGAAGSAPGCHGSLEAKSKRKAIFSMTCDNGIESFELKANKKLAKVRDPTYAFNCSRTSPKSFYCEDIHSFIPDNASGVLKTKGELCPTGHKPLKVKVKANHPDGSSTRFTLAGPC